MAKIHYGVQTSRKQGGSKMAKIQNGVKPDIFIYAPRAEALRRGPGPFAEEDARLQPIRLRPAGRELAGRSRNWTKSNRLCVFFLLFLCFFFVLCFFLFFFFFFFSIIFFVVLLFVFFLFFFFLFLSPKPKTLNPQPLTLKPKPC